MEIYISNEELERIVDRVVERRLRPINRSLGIIEQEEHRMTTVQEDIDAAIAGDEEAITALAARVQASTDAQIATRVALEGQIKTLEATIATLRGEGVNVAALEQHLADLKTTADAIDPAPAPRNTVYTFTPAEAQEDARFSVSGFETVPVPAVPAVPGNPEAGTAETPEVPAVPAEPLLYFSGDENPGEQNGAALPGYTVYAGAVQAVPAA